MTPVKYGIWHSASIPAAGYPDRAWMEELLRRHHSVLFEDHAVLHHELHIAQRVNVGERIAGDGYQIGEEPGFDGAALLDDIGGFVAVDRDRAQDVGRGNGSRLPGVEEG